jgi:hypothetical protein
MHRLATLVLSFLLLPTALSNGLTKEQRRAFALDKCNAGAGCFYWNSKQCLWHNEEGAGPFLLPNTPNAHLKEKPAAASGGVKHFAAPGYKVKLTETDLLTCPTPTDSQCTVYKSTVLIEVTGPRGRQSHRGIGFCGS